MLWQSGDFDRLVVKKGLCATFFSVVIGKIEKNVAFLTDNVQNLSADQMKMKADLPSESCRMATLICTVLPVMVCYPFFQKYFVKGITVGSIKG